MVANEAVHLQSPLPMQRIRRALAPCRAVLSTPMTDLTGLPQSVARVRVAPYDHIRARRKAGLVRAGFASSICQPTPDPMVRAHSSESGQSQYWSCVGVL